MNTCTRSPSDEVTKSLGSKGAEATDYELDRLGKALHDSNEELLYLRHFFNEADFGPAHEDVVLIIMESYDGPIPEGYRNEEEY